MSYRTNFSLIIQSVVEAMTFPMTITDLDENADRILIQVCDLYHAEPGRVITIGGNDYTITAIDDSTRIITLTPGPAIIVSTFDLYGVHYFDGTPLAVGKELRDIPDAIDKTPMVFLLNPYKEKLYEDLENPLERQTTATLFFLTQANFDAWSTGDLQSNAVRPMERLEQNFTAQVKQDIRFENINSESEATPRIKFGVFITNKGTVKGFEAMDLSGVQQDKTFKLWRPDCGVPDTCVAYTLIENNQFDESFNESFS